MTTILSIISALPGIITVIIELMKLAEEAYPGSGTGASKKKWLWQQLKQWSTMKSFGIKLRFFSQGLLTLWLYLILGLRLNTIRDFCEAYPELSQHTLPAFRHPQDVIRSGRYLDVHN